MLYSIVHPPVVNIEPENITVKEGDTVQFNCTATGVGESRFVYQWFLNREVVADENTSILIINADSVDKTGDYSCSVQNIYKDIGRSEKTATLLFSGRYKYGKYSFIN